MLLVIILMLQNQLDHATGKRPDGKGTGDGTYVEVQHNFYSDYREMVDALWEANEEVPDSCRTGMIL